jgi:putative transposase
LPRKPRFFLPGVPAHVVQRGNNRQPTFFADEDYRAYLGWLGEAARRYGCAVHAYVLMTNHVHLLVTPEARGSVSRMMQYVGRRYVPYVNRAYGRSGTLWEGRFKSAPIDSEAYLLVCSRYIEMNPVRAGIAATPVDYPWSSYHANALGREDRLVSPHPVLLALAGDANARCAAYRALFRGPVDDRQLGAIRSALQTGTPLGNDRFRARIERALHVKVGYDRRGRPRSPAVSESRRSGPRRRVRKA